MGWLAGLKLAAGNGGFSLTMIAAVAAFVAGGFFMDVRNDASQSRMHERHAERLDQFAVASHQLHAAILKAHWQREHNLWGLANDYSETTIEIADTFERYLDAQGIARDREAQRIREIRRETERIRQDALYAQDKLDALLDTDAWSALPVPVGVRCIMAGFASTGGVLIDGSECPGSPGIPEAATENGN